MKLSWFWKVVFGTNTLLIGIIMSSLFVLHALIFIETGELHTQWHSWPVISDNAFSLFMGEFLDAALLVWIFSIYPFAWLWIGFIFSRAEKTNFKKSWPLILFMFCIQATGYLIATSPLMRWWD